MRFDLLKAVSDLATRVTKWSLACDRRLHRLMCYINSYHDLSLVGWIGDKISELNLTIYADADFAGDKKTMKSTSGCILALEGPNTYMPFVAASVKQKAVSHSTPEAELIAADAAMRKEGIPAMDVWDKLLGRKVTLTLLEDNQACLQIVKTGKNPALRHIHRTHGVSASALHHVFYPDDPAEESPIYKIRGVETEKQFADLFTKGFTKPLEWSRAIANVGLRRPRRGTAIGGS